MKHWKEGGHKQECKRIASQKFGIKLWIKHMDKTPGGIISFSTKQTTMDGFCKPRGMPFDETRQCQFNYHCTGPGFREVVETVQKEPTWGGRKTFMKMSFSKAG